MIGPALARGNHQGIPTRVSATAISGEGNPGYATIARVIRALNIRMVSEIVQDLAGGWDPGGSRGVQGGHAILRADRRGLEKIKILVETEGCFGLVLACTQEKVVPVMVTNRGQNAAPCAPAPSWVKGGHQRACPP